MSATTWFIIAIVGFSLAGVTLIAAIFMFFKMNILAIVGDLTGKTVAREIKAMREMNTATGNKIHRSSRVNIERGTLTDKVDLDVPGQSPMAMAHSSKRLDKTTGGLAPVVQKIEQETVSARIPTTESFSSDTTEVLMDDINATEVLTDSNATEVLTDLNATEVLTETSATEVLVEETETVIEGTTVLEEVLQEHKVVQGNINFKVKRKLVEIHTDEEIK